MSDKKFKTETHLHTSDVSMCAKLTAREMVKLYHEAGYKTLFISDHYIERFFDYLGDIPWNDKITIFMSGYYRAKEAAKEFGINVLPSVEVVFKDNLNHYLLYGITEEFLCKYPMLYKVEVSDFYEIAKENGVFVVQAHPLRDAVCIPTPDFVDGFEIYNSNPRHKDYSDKVKEIAKENSLYFTAGSDAHRVDDSALTGICTDMEITSVEGFIDIIKSGDFEVIGG